MLHYFPTPYPDELWYSVLCRYHVRSGNANLLMTRSAGQNLPSGFPDGSIKAVLDMLPEGLFSVRETVLGHTLFPYHSRMKPLEEKEAMIRHLESGSRTETGRAIPTKAWPALRYCPVCRKEEQEMYGESYWHREHQIPYMAVCPRHHCRLAECHRKGWNGLDLILPHFIEAGPEPDYHAEPYEVPLAKMLYAYLTAPLELGPTEGYNNLVHALERQGYRAAKGSRVMMVDTERLYLDLLGFYGERMTRGCFGKRIPSYMPMKLRNWCFLPPERYIFLAALIGQPPEVTFGRDLDAAPSEKLACGIRESRREQVRRKRSA